MSATRSRAFAVMAMVAVLATFAMTGTIAVAQSPRLSIGVPVRPAVVVTDGVYRVLYELHVENRSDVTVTLSSLEIRTDDAQDAVTVDGDRLIRAFDAPSNPDAPLAIAGGGRRVIYIDLGRKRPPRVLHHVLRSTAASVDLQVEVDPTPPIVLGPPLAGGPWASVHHPDWPRGHRRVFYRIGGTTRLPGRYTIDFVKLDDAGRTVRGDADDRDLVVNALGYGADVLAVRDATVDAVRDDMPEPTRVSARVKHPQEDAAGNYVSLDLGNGRFAVYEHLKPGSLRVRAGQRVRRGDVIAQLGFSGDSTGPHLHLHVGDAAAPLAAEGRPFVFDRFELLGRYHDVATMGTARWQSDAIGLRHNERPGPNAVIRFGAPVQEPTGRNDQKETIRRMLVELHENGEFTGSVLVARAGTVIYRDAIASTPDEASKLLDSPSNIASLAKAFTAMAVMMLAEQGKLKYDDPIDSHVKELAGATPGITIRHLLTHTSGIPDVGDLGIDRPDVDEGDVVTAVRTHHTRFARPGLRYRYSNTGYMILAMAVEHASGQSFDDFLQRAIFDPLQMRRTHADPRPRGARETKGEGGLVSTVDDLLTWDQALYGERLVRAKTFADAMVPAKVAEGECTYGFGWNIAQTDGQTYMWHTGNSGGQRAFLGRRLGDRVTIILLTQGNSRRVEIADAIVDILHDRPYVPPKLSIARRLVSTIETQGLDAALALYEQLRNSPGSRYDFSEGELNGLGYGLLERGRHADAIRVFDLNVRQFPSSSNAYDSLGEAYYRSGQRAEAAQAYTRAVALDPSNVNARAMLQKLK